jgi:hypothetical protein
MIVLRNEIVQELCYVQHMTYVEYHIAGIFCDCQIFAEFCIWKNWYSLHKYTQIGCNHRNWKRKTIRFTDQIPKIHTAKNITPFPTSKMSRSAYAPLSQLANYVE